MHPALVAIYACGINQDKTTAGQLRPISLLDLGAEISPWSLYESKEQRHAVIIRLGIYVSMCSSKFQRNKSPYLSASDSSINNPLSPSSPPHYTLRFLPIHEPIIFDAKEIGIRFSTTTTFARKEINTFSIYMLLYILKVTNKRDTKID